jgi:pyruvate/2-oxoglutarate/acetoin dehydrogenase E1 component
VRVTAPPTPVPFAPVLEDAHMVGAERITAAVRAVMDASG